MSVSFPLPVNNEVVINVVTWQYPPQIIFFQNTDSELLWDTDTACFYFLYHKLLLVAHLNNWIIPFKFIFEH